MRLAALITFLAVSLGASGQDLLVQRFSTSRSIGRGPALNLQVFQAEFGSPVQAGNTLVVSVTQHSPTTTFGYTLGDDKGNIYTPVVTNTSAAAKHSMVLYVATNSIAGARELFATNRSGASIDNVQMMGVEFYGVLAYNPADVSKGANGSSTSAATGNMTPGTTGDLVVQFAVGNISGTSIQCPSFTNASQANLAWTTSWTDPQDVIDIQYGIYNSTTAFSPTVTFGASQVWNTVAVCLKQSAGQGSPRPTLGIYIAGLFSISQPQTDNSFSAAGTPLTNSLQVPTIGNLQVQAFTGAAANLITNTLSSGGAGLWVNAPLGSNRNLTGGGAENSQFLLASNWVGAANGWQFITNYYKSTTAGGSFGTDATIKWYDICNASAYPYDTRSTNVGTQSSHVSLTEPGAITPAGSNELVICEVQQNTATATNIAAPFLFDSFRYDGEGFNGPQNMDQAGGWAHFITTNSSSTQPTWSPFDNGAIGTWAADMIALKGSNATFGIIPADRLYPWNGAVGVEGGLTDSSVMTVYTTLGSTATVAQVNSAISACPSNQVVKLLAGTFNMSGQVVMKSGVVLKGSGMSNTIMAFTSSGIGLRSSSFFNVYGSLSFPISGQSLWTNGFGYGVTNLSFASPTNLAVGNLVYLEQRDDPSYMNPAGYEGNPGATRGGTNNLIQITEVKNISGNTVTVWPPVVPLFSGSFSPDALWMPASSWNSRMGVEDMTVDGTSSTGLGDRSANICFESCRDVWIKNVKSIKPGHSHFAFSYGYFRVEVRNCYMYDDQSSSSQSYGIDTMIGSGGLFENNAVEKVVSAFVPHLSTSVNAWLYNYSTNAYYTASANFLIGGSMPHGVGTVFDLFEGNHIQEVSCDFIHGSHAYEVYFRNRITGWEAYSYPGGPTTHALECYHIDITNRFISSVGNILGTTGKELNYQSVPGSTQSSPIYDVGLENTAYGLGLGNDQTTVDTFFRHMDYDTVTAGITYNPTNSYVALPVSLYYTNKPAFFGSLAWPPFNPTNTTAAAIDPTNIPAGFRLVFGFDPSADPLITVQPSNQTVTAPAAATFSVTATGTAPVTYQWLKNGTPIGGATSSSVSTGATTTGNNGDVYAVQVTSAVGGPLQSVSGNLTVNAAPPPPGSSITVNGNINFNGTIRTQ